MREAGCTAAEELAFTFCSAIAYADSVLARGISYVESHKRPLQCGLQ